MKTTWRSVSRAKPCEVCGKPDRCSRSVDGGAATCFRVTEAPNGYTLVKPVSGGGAIFRRAGAARNGEHRAARPTATAPATRIDWSAEAERCAAAITPERVNELAAGLGVTAASLTAIGIGLANAADLSRWGAGFAGEGETPGFAYTFPERDGRGHVVGLSLRAPDGRKGFPRGAKRGLIVPKTLRERTGPVLICEGASDVAALESLGLAAIGRPSNSGGAAELAVLLRGREVLILGENDQKESGAFPGRDGAEAIAKKLAQDWDSAQRFAFPPAGVKDVRQWLNSRVAAGLSLANPEACRAAGAELLAALQADAQEINPEKKAKPSKAQTIINLAEQDVELFHSGDRAFASINVDGVRQTFAIASKHFKTWLSRTLYESTNQAASSEDLATASMALTGRAMFDAPEYPVAVRVAESEGVIYYDLADDQWRVVRIDETGWSVIASDESPVRFIRPRGVLALPEPDHGGDLNELREIVNVPDDESWALTIGWMIGAIRPTGPYPILAVNGEQGSAKSTFCRLLRAAIDPNAAPLRSEPKEPRDLMISATNSRIIAFDNLSRVSPWLSDCLCRLATGGGFAVRAHYENDEEIIFDAMRPTIINGIEALASRSDLLDRCLTLTLPTIPESKRRTEAEIWRLFRERQPRILGALFTAAAAALRTMRTLRPVESRQLPRMADFAIWAEAAEGGLGLVVGAFMAAYAGNRADANESAIESSIIGPLIIKMIDEKTKWSGTAQELLAELESDRWSNDRTRQRTEWPKSARKLGGDLRRLAPNLRAIGIDVLIPDKKSGRDKRKIIELEQTENRGKQRSAQAAQAATDAKSEIGTNDNESTADHCGPLRTVGDDLRTIAVDHADHCGSSNGSTCPVDVASPFASIPDDSPPADHADHADHLSPLFSELDPRSDAERYADYPNAEGAAVDWGDL